MAQTATPDSQLQEDPSLTGEDATQEHKSFFGKLKDKTKVKTSKLKTKLKPGSKTSTGEDAVDDDSSSSSSDEESEGPAHNAVSGVTQPEFERRAEQAKSDHSQGLASEPAQSFPGNFAGIVDDRTESESKEDESSLSKGFEGLSTNDKDDQNESELKPEESTLSKDKSSLSKGFEGLSTNDKDESAVENTSADELGDGKPVTQKIQETVNEGKEKVFPSGGAYEQTYASPDKPLSEQAEPAVDSTTEAGKSWTQWAAEKVGYAKDTVAAKAPTTADGKPIHEAAYGAALGAKDAAVERAAASKDSLASSTPSDPSQQSYVQKATGGIYGAKDKFFSSTEPGEHDKALSQKVTESVGNLPATLKSSLGFGAKSGATSPTTTPALSEGSLPLSEESSDGAAQSPGLVSRITGLFSSKKPASDTSTAPETTISETGAETETKVSEPTNFS